MYKNIHTFIPFEHENIDVKNNLINFARGQDHTKPEGALAKTLIYTNLVDYLAQHLLMNLSKMVSIFTFQKFGGVFHLDTSVKRVTLPLGDLQRELGYFEFPNKKDFLGNLDEFKQLRNDVMHNLMKLDPNDATNIVDKNIIRIGEIAEDCLAKYNAISNGLASTWKAVNSGL